MSSVSTETGADGMPDCRIGMLTPSSNTVLEPMTNALLAPVAGRVTAHFARFRVTRIALDSGADSQFAPDTILAAAELLADAAPSVIAWNGTAASWLGFDADDRLCAAIRERTGIAATSAIISLNRLMRLMRVRRIGLVTPYTAGVAERITRNYAEVGIETVAASHAGLEDNFAFATLPEARVQQMCADVAAQGPDAIIVLCTNMRGPLIAPQVERDFDIPVLDSISVTLWGAMQEAGLDTRPLERFGRLFRHDARPSAA